MQAHEDMGDLISMFKNLMLRESKEDRARVFSVVPSDMTRRNEHKLKYFFTVRVAEHLKRLPRKVVECLSLKILKT